MPKKKQTEIIWLGKVVIADGYHRTCAIYAFNEDAWIRGKIT